MLRCILDVSNAWQIRDGFWKDCLNSEQSSQLGNSTVHENLYTRNHSSLVKWSKVDRMVGICLLWSWICSKENFPIHFWNKNQVLPFENCSRSFSLEKCLSRFIQKYWRTSDHNQFERIDYLERTSWVVVPWPEIQSWWCKIERKAAGFFRSWCCNTHQLIDYNQRRYRNSDCSRTNLWRCRS